MRFYIYLLFFLTIGPAIQAQSLVEKFRSKPGELPFSRSELITRSRSAATNKLFGNEVPGVIWRDSLFFLFAGIGGASEVEYAFEIPASLQNVSGYFGLYNIDDTDGAELIYVTGASSGNNSGCRCISIKQLSLNQNTGKAEIDLSLDNIVGFFDLDGDQQVDYLQYLQDTRDVVVLGYPTSEGIQPPAFHWPDLRSQFIADLALKFESEVASDLSNVLSSFWDASDYDFNNDGTIELVFSQVDSSGQLLGIRVVNGFNNDNTRVIDLRNLENRPNGAFRGFFDVVDGNGKELVIGNQTILNVNGGSTRLPDHFVPAIFTDTDGDGLVDIVGQDTLSGKVQIYGQMTATPVDDVFQQSLGLQVEAVYPNPVVDVFQLPIQLAENMLVQIRLFAQDGRLVRDLYRGNLPTGKHMFSGSVAGLTPGLYHVNIKVPGGQLSQKIVVK